MIADLGVKYTAAARRQIPQGDPCRATPGTPGLYRAARHSGAMTSAHELRRCPRRPRRSAQRPARRPEDGRRLLVSLTRAGQQTAPNAIAISRDTLAPLDAWERDAGLSGFIFAGGTKSIQHDCPVHEGGKPRRRSPMKTSFLYSTAVLLLIGGGLCGGGIWRACHVAQARRWCCSTATAA